MAREIKVYLQDILDSIEAVEEYVKGVSEANFLNNRQVQDAVMRRLEIIGEAVKGIDEKTRADYPDIPWKKIAGMRDILIHEYFGANPARVWAVIVNDLPSLKEKIRQIAGKLL